MKKIFLPTLFIFIIVVLFQMENLQQLLNSLLSTGIAAGFLLAMSLSLVIFILLSFSLRYIRKIKRSI